MHSKRILGVVLAFIIMFAAFSVLQPRITTEATLKIDSNLLERMENEDGLFTALIKVVWNPNIEPIMYQHDAVVSELKAEAVRTQEPVMTYLRQKRDAEVLNTFWLSNIILVKANEDTIRELATLSTVEKVIASFRLETPDGEKREIGTAAATPATWNIEKVRAPEVWDQLGIFGEGIKFATTDSGVDITHQDLAGTMYTSDAADPKYPGGWIEFDSNGSPIWSTPHDTWMHGTATYGVIVGDSKSSHGAVGMAPEATGMHALSLPGGGGTFPQVLAGLEWVLDPYDEDGNHYQFPRVSSHSWGAVGYYSELIEPIRNMWFAGHFVVASIGNSYEGSSGSPGNIYETFSAGMTDINDYVDPQSSGEIVYKTDFTGAPVDWPDSWIVPDVSAPGVDVIVPVPGNDYVYWGGTSFSSPHVAGAAVLMLSGNPSLTPPELAAALQGTAVWYDRYYPSRPDTRYGWGRIDAFEAVVQVALPQGIVGTVRDALTNQPIPNAEVHVIEAGRTVYTDANGHYDIRLQPGTYAVEVSKFGYNTEAFTGVEVLADTFTTLDAQLALVPPGYLSGHVYHAPTGIGIPGVMIEALNTPIPVETTTSVDGAYTLALPPGTYDFKASAYGFKDVVVTGVQISEGITTTQDFGLIQPAAVIAVVGDYPSSPGMITEFLREKGYSADAYSTIAEVIPVVPQYTTVIVNQPGYPSYADMDNFISATDINGVGVLWLDSWMEGTGGYNLWYYSYYYGLPIGFSFERYTDYWSGSDVFNYYKVEELDSDILDEWPVGYYVAHDIRGYWHDSAYYYMYSSETPTRQYLASFGFCEYGYYYDYGGTSIVKIDRGTNKWMMLSLHANTMYTDCSGWSDDSIAVFLNSINWAAKAHVEGPKFVVWDLKVEPEVSLWRDPRTVSVGIKNVGWTTGTETLEMNVDTVLEGTAPVTLAPGEYAHPSWTVSRFDVGTYTVKVKHLTTTFTVRAPTITLQVYEIDRNKPLAGADVYGYYRRYMGPGWQEQWSMTYGGYGHSQHAQPVGDIDEDGVNEVIVGGYEYLDGRARILSYNAALGTYVEEYVWYVPGGSYHSPSGSTVVDLDEDGDDEFVVSWTYSGADGIYAYDWDGTTLTELDYYPCGFVFDVYTCDYDDDGHMEVLIANAPWGGTPYNVVAFRWESGAFVWEAAWSSGYYWETSMIRSGDIDNDGSTEVVACVSDGGYSTLGTFALNWNPGTNSWTADLVYGDLINGGTHYGIAVGDVDGDGTPEIGIGNNVNGYYGAGVVLCEWNGVSYSKVWEGTWPTEECVIEAIDIGDADNDGSKELIVGGGDVHLIVWTGASYAEEATITQTSGLLAGSIVADTDTDGMNEIKACDIIGLGPGKEWIFQYSATPTPESGWTFKYLGTTDANGMLTINSPASVVDMYLMVHKGDKTPLGYQYLLVNYHYVDNDISVVKKPTSTTEGIVISRLNARGLVSGQHMGVTWLLYDGIPVIFPFMSFRSDPTRIVVTPEVYAFYHWLNIIDPFGSWWYYFMNTNRVAAIAGGQTYDYSFAGTIQGYITHSQTGNSVTLNWNAQDSFGHDITGISVEQISWLTSETTSYVPAPLKPGMLETLMTAVGETIDYYPLIALYDNRRIMMRSGYVQWYEETLTIDVSKVVNFAQLNFVAGPYGNPNARMYVIVITEVIP